MWFSDLKPKKKHRFGKQAPKTQRVKDDVKRRKREPTHTNTNHHRTRIRTSTTTAAHLLKVQ